MAIAQTIHGDIWYADHRREHFDYPPLLLIHGAAGTHLDWSLHLRRMNAVVPDLPGHGKSDSLPSRTQIEDYATDMIALLDALEIPQAVIVGQSMGSAIALTMALQAPGRAAGLILIGAGAKFDVNPRILDNLLSNQAKVAEWFTQWMWSSSTPQRPRELGYEQFMKTPPQVVLDDYTACQQFDLRSELDNINIPVLIFGSAEDRMTPLADAAELQAELPDAELVVVDNAGHMMQLEQPEWIVNRINQWLSTKVDSGDHPRHST
jgi:pimeloyl-ACP methyl ester carboxylesterase